MGPRKARLPRCIANDQGQRAQKADRLLRVDPDQPGVCGLRSRSPAPSLWALLSYREASWIVHPFREDENALLCSAELSSIRLHVDVVHQTPDDEMECVELIITV